VIALTVAGKAVRDALFCSQFPAADVPKVMTGGAILSMLTALAVARAVRAVGPVRCMVCVLLVNTVIFGLAHAVFERAPRGVALFLYLHVSAVASVIVSGFWSAVNERFDPHTLRLSVTRIGLGASVGGFIGGLTAERISALAGTRHALLALALFSALSALAIWFLRAPEGARRALEPATRMPLESGYLRQLALFVGLTALGASVMDFAFKARAMEHFTSAESLVRFFSLFYMAINVLSFLMQYFATAPILEQAGLGVALAGLPAMVTLSGLFALIVPGLPAQTLLKGADNTLSGSLFRSAYEPLYTPLPEGRRRSVKAVIDVTFDKLGDALGSGFCWLLGLLAPMAAIRGATLAAVVLAAITFVLAARLYRGYVVELAESLRTGVTVLDETEIRDRTTRLTLSRTLGHLTRERLLGEIEKLHGEEAAPPAGAAPSGLRGKPPSPPVLGSDPPAIVAALASGDPKRLRGALEVAEPALASFVIPLLARDDVGAQAMKVLGVFGERITGQLADALLDHERYSAPIRRRLVRVMTSSPSAWASAGLSAALDDPDFEVRQLIVQGMEDLALRGIAAPLSREAALSVATRELTSGASTSSDRAQQALRILGLAFDGVRLARSALASDDQQLRGTALEYLENVLPDSVRSLLFEALLVERPGRPRRVERDLLEELRRALGWQASDGAEAHVATEVPPRSKGSA
jgi:hypothetical protein